MTRKSEKSDGEMPRKSKAKEENISSRHLEKQRMILSRNITCDSTIIDLLTPKTIELANIVVNEINEEDPGLFVQITNQNNLHAALALPSSPVSQGVNADDSLEAFREWLIERAVHVNRRSQVPQNSDVSLAFHQLSLDDAVKITNREWMQQRWNVEIQDNGVGEFAIVFLMARTGRHRATFTIDRLLIFSYIFISSACFELLACF
jgi:hypothetical protein